ncbi:MAG: UPF0175 family protein [Bacteroidota bacterium]
MTIEISDNILRQIQLSEENLKLELAMLLFEKYQLSFGQARKLSGLNVIAFQQALAKNKIPLHYDVEDLDRDLQQKIE